VGLDNYLRDRTKLAVRIAEEPRFTIVRGLEQMFDAPLLPQRLIREGQRAEIEERNPIM
jgi:hypothetical protein